MTLNLNLPPELEANMQSEAKPNCIGTPISEVNIDIPLVRSLLETQHPDLADLPISRVDAGWDNTMFRLGNRLSIRLPRRQVAAALIEHEQTWLPHIASRLPLPVPTPYRFGKPGQGYPWKWSVLPWLTGVTADQQQPDGEQAKSFALFLRSLHIPAPPDAPKNPVRGVPLSHRAVTIQERMQRLELKTNLITPKIKNTWNQALKAPIDILSTWLHGDLHPRNILVENGVITGIIDWGDMTSGDTATDLASIWMLFRERTTREQVIAEYGNISQATLQRALGWAIAFGVLLLDTGLIDNPRHAIIGKRILHRVALDL